MDTVSNADILQVRSSIHSLLPKKNTACILVSLFALPPLPLWGVNGNPSDLTSATTAAVALPASGHTQRVDARRMMASGKVALINQFLLSAFQLLVSWFVFLHPYLMPTIYIYYIERRRSYHPILSLPCHWLMAEKEDEDGEEDKCNQLWRVWLSPRRSNDHPRVPCVWHGILMPRVICVQNE